jgi:hypothetical protein
MLRRHRYALVGLFLYWPGIFIATHVPINRMVRQAGLSDKALHFCGYLVLAFFIFAAVSPYKKLNWLNIKPWIVLLVVTIYAAVDEYLQQFVNRSPDFLDFVANMSGALTAMIILTFLSFWPALLILTAIYIFALTNLSTSELVFSRIFINASFHFLAYAFFTLVWIQHIDRFIQIQRKSLLWIAVAAAVPLAFLLFVKLISPLMGKQVWLVDVSTAITGILLTVAVSWATCFVNRRITKNTENM